MSKVTITEEQASEIEKRKQNFSNESTIKKHLEGWEYKRILNSLTLDELIRALYIGYEINPEFKVREWVTVIDHECEKYVGITALVTNTNALKLTPIGLDFDNGNQVFKLHEVRHATPEEIAEEKQRRFWHENGRGVGEFKKNDVIYNKNIGDLDEIMTGFTKMNYTDVYEIICFAHDRKDIKND